ncbi:MAG: PQQ-binding-like beta-propeller repeat protein [Deltaproteobacteria bacterium]
MNSVNGRLKRLFTASILAGFMMLPSCAGRVAYDAAVSEWGAFMHDDARTNTAPHDISVPMRLKWQRDLSTLSDALEAGRPQVYASPVISGHTIFAGSKKGRFYSMDIESGDVNWTYDAGSPIEAPASAGEKLVCFGTVEGELKCLDRTNGKEALSFKARSEVLSSPVITDKDVFFSTADRRLYAVSIDTGEKLWAYVRTSYQTIAPRIIGSPAYADGRLYHLFPDGYLVSIDAATGKEVWAKKTTIDFKSHGIIRRTPLVTSRGVFMIDGANSIVSFNKANGEIADTFRFAKAYDFLAIENGLVLAGPEEISFFELPSGKKRWSLKPEGVVASLTATDNVLFAFLNYKKPFLGIEHLSEARARLYAIGIKDGQPLWQRTFDETISSYGASTGRYLAVMNDAGVLQLFEPE